MGLKKNSEPTADEELQRTINAYVDAAHEYRLAAERSIRERVLARFPTATHVRITAIMDESYSEHAIQVFDNNIDLNSENNWPEDEPDGYDWLLEASEGAAWGNDVVTFPLRETVKETA